MTVKSQTAGPMLPPAPHFGLLRGFTGDLILRPWFDAVVVRVVTDWYVPLSRAWAAATVAEGDPDRFVAEVGEGFETHKDFSKALGTVVERKARYQETLKNWEETFFDGGRTPTETLVSIESSRLDAADRYMATRGAFLSIRRKLPRVKWDTDRPEITAENFSPFEPDPAKAFHPGATISIEVSQTVPTERGSEGWIRMTSPLLGDVATARVFNPPGKPRGTIIWLHGVGMEPEMWKTLTDPVCLLLEAGYCVIQPEGPWHGRRTPDGLYGGETVFAKGVTGFIDLFRSWITECGHWIAWARNNISDNVGIGGLSLGALTSQLAVSVCGDWAEEMKPDACLLATTTQDVLSGALQGSLSQRLGVAQSLDRAEWDVDQLKRWSLFIEPWETPAIPPEKIVMLLGEVDTVTPFEGGIGLSEKWAIPSENIFVRRQGHFSGAMGLYRNPMPLLRTGNILESG